VSLIVSLIAKSGSVRFESSCALSLDRFHQRAGPLTFTARDHTDFAITILRLSMQGFRGGM
jgi:hypothetical protein